MILKLFILLFCFLHAQEEINTEKDEQIFYGFEYGKNIGLYRTFGLDKICFTKDGYKVTSLGFSLGVFEPAYDVIHENFRLSLSILELMNLAMIVPFPFYRESYAYLIAEKGIASLYYGYAWFPLLEFFMLSLSLKKDKHLLIFSVEQSAVAIYYYLINYFFVKKNVMSAAKVIVVHVSYCYAF